MSSEAEEDDGPQDIPGLGPDIYRQWRASALGAITERLERRLVLDLIGNIEGRRILDLGCGDGDLAVDLALRGARVTGIDTSAAMIAAARARAASAGTEIEFHLAAAQALPFPSEQFDVVVAVTVLCFVDDPMPVFQEAARVLRPGGRFVIGELGKWNSWAAARRLRGWLGSPLWRRGRFRTPGELHSLAEAAGLRAEVVRGAIFYPRVRLAARVMAPLDACLGRVTTFGAAFLALRARKDGAGG